MMKSSIVLGTVLAGILCCLLENSAVGADWPDLSQPASAIGGGEHDAAVVIGVENYFAVPGVPGAKSNATAWYEYLTETRGLPVQNVKLLTNEDATREGILGAARTEAGLASKNGTLWFVYIGHGAPSTDGKDGLLVGVDAQQKAESLQSRSVRRGELLKTLMASPAASIRVVLDACFSGRGQDGASIMPGIQPLLTVATSVPLDPRIVVLTAAKGDQFAGTLPGTDRPAFSYLVLGGLRGWAADEKGNVTAGSLWTYAKNALAATLRGRDQTPDLIGSESAVVAPSAGEEGPNLARLAEATSGSGAIQFNVSAPPEVPKANQPSMATLRRLPRAQLPGAMEQAGGISFSAVDVEALGKFEETTKFERGDASPESKAARWRTLGTDVKTYADIASKRAAQWDAYAKQVAYNAVLENEKDEAALPEDKATGWKWLINKYPEYKKTVGSRAQAWERYAKELTAAKAAKEKRDELMDADWPKLKKLLSYSVVSAREKRKFARTFVQAYGKTSDEDPYVADLAKYLPPGTVKVTPRAKAESILSPGKAGIQWVRIPGGTFTMGADEIIFNKFAPTRGTSSRPRHEVTIKSFQISKTLVTYKQYKACVDAGVCTVPGTDSGCLWGMSSLEKKLPMEKYPINCVDWEQSKKFSEWAGGRLPTEAEWEYAARSGGKEQKYPWGDEDATCKRAALGNCKEVYPAQVCSKPAGNTKQGLCDMTGNVSEWVEDGFHGTYDGAPADGSAWEDSGSGRVVRGGGFQSGDGQSAARGSWNPDTRDTTVGFRIVKSNPWAQETTGTANVQPEAQAGSGGIQWVAIPAGAFTMGSNGFFSGDEGPAHSVTIKSFQLGKTLVTNKQYKACVAAGACTAATSSGSSFEGDDQPVVGVDWNQAKAFSEWVGGRLPSEAEWEYAARSGGKDRKYPWGNEKPTCQRAVIGGCGSATAPVCSQQTGNTEQGLCDMAGNASEWVEDLHHDTYNGAPTDGSAWEGAGSERVLRGGSWGGDAGGARSAHRGALDQGYHGGYVSFRPAR